MKGITALILFLYLNTQVLAAAIPGQFLLESFSATCSSQGNWTKLALNDSRALISTLENLRDDENCKSITGAISQLTLLESHLSSLDSEYNSQIEIAKLEGQEIELMSQIANSQDPIVISELEGSLRSIQLDKAGLVALDEQNAYYNPANIQNLYSQILTSTNSAYNTIAANQLCMDNHPGILPSATALAGSVAGAAAYVNPVLGIGIAAATEFVGQTVNYYRSRGYNYQIKNIANGSTVREGFKCALETLSNRWCQIRDAEKFLKLEASLKRRKSIQSELSLINEINDIDIPVFLDWLEKVKAGAPASNSADHQRRTSIIFREASVRVAKSRGEGLFAENRTLYANARNNIDKYSVIKSIIEDLLSALDSAGPSNPLVEIYNVGYVPFYLLGLPEQPTYDNGTPRPFSDFNPFKDWPNGSYQPDYQELISNYNQWVDKANARVAQEYNLVFQPDPTQILAIYSEASSNVYKRSTAEAVENILKFVTENKPERSQGSVFDDLYDSTIAELETIHTAALGTPNLTEIPCLDTSGYLCDDERRKLEIIFQAARLEFGSIFFKNRLETILRVAINEYVKNSSNTNSNQVAQLLAADSYLEVLSKVSGTDNKTRIKQDLSRAKAVTLSNMISFGQTFGFYINNLMFTNERLVRHKYPSVAETYKRDRAELCFLLTSLPEWPQSIRMSYCYGSQLESDFTDGPKTSSIDYNYINQNFESRACEYSDFIRNSKIYEDWGIKL